MAIYWILTKLV